MRPAKPLAERFWSKVDRRDDTECWPFLGKLHRGYGRMRLGGRGSAHSHAHRVAYELLVGPVPDGLQLDHLCRNRACVNPRHLEPVSIRENVLRGVGPSAENARKTRCVHGHDLTPENTYITAAGARSCRTCAARANRQKKRAARLRREDSAPGGMRP